jgi:hypothetical protein
MPVQIRLFQMNPNQIASLLDNYPCGGIGYRKNSIIGSDPGFVDIFPEPISDFLWNEKNME